jgi:hypothetical protein
VYIDKLSILNVEYQNLYIKDINHSNRYKKFNKIITLTDNCYYFNNYNNLFLLNYNIILINKFINNYKLFNNFNKINIKNLNFFFYYFFKNIKFYSNIYTNYNIDTFKYYLNIYYNNMNTAVNTFNDTNKIYFLFNIFIKKFLEYKLKKSVYLLFAKDNYNLLSNNFYYLSFLKRLKKVQIFNKSTVLIKEFIEVLFLSFYTKDVNLLKN